jgi:hypothetical protein
VATRKQRRRREKEKRHEYEVVYLDSEGNEVEPDVEGALDPKKPKGSNGSQGKSGRAGREPQPPSWQRAIRRGALFLPFILGFVYLTNRNNASPGGILAVILLFTVMVIPLGYYTDYFVWRSHQKRLASRPRKR